MKINKLMIARIVFAAWAVLWLIFLIRPYFKRDLVREYRTLISRDLEGKRSYVTGDDLYGFIMNCRDLIPAGPFTYSIVGLEDDHLGRCRAAYYLYPAICGEDMQYVLVYKKSGYGLEGYLTFKKFSEDKYILRKIK